MTSRGSGLGFGGSDGTESSGMSDTSGVSSTGSEDSGTVSTDSLGMSGTSGSYDSSGMSERVSVGDTVVPVLFSTSIAVRDFGVSASLGASEALFAVFVGVTVSLASTEVFAIDVDVGKVGGVGLNTVIPAFLTTSSTSGSSFVSLSLVADEVASAVFAGVAISLAEREVLAVDVDVLHVFGVDRGSAEGG